jgi:hypothetical protein
MDGRGQWIKEIMRLAVTIEEARTKLRELTYHSQVKQDGFLGGLVL